MLITIFQALMVDPFWEVTPLKAVTETVTQFILHPLEIAGTSIGKFAIVEDLRKYNLICTIHVLFRCFLQ